MPLRPVIYQPQQFDYEHPGVKAASLRAMAEEARGQKLRSDELQRQQEAASQVRGVVGVYGGKITPKVAEEISIIDPTAGMAVNKYLGQQEEQEAKGRKEARLAESAALDLNLKKLAHVGGVLNTVQDEPSMHRAIGDLLNREMIPRDLAMHYLTQPFTPELQAEIKQAIESTKTTEQQLKDQLAQNEEARKVEDQKMQAALHPAQVAKGKFEAEKAEQTAKGTEKIQPAQQARLEADKEQAAALAKHQAEQMKLTRRGQDITRAGQIMTDLRSREMAEISRENKPPTSAENRTLGFYIRAKDAADNIATMEGEMSKKGFLGQVAYKKLPEFAQSEFNQSYRQSQRAFTEARLRKDSGASIPEHEYENDAKTYFPQPGNGPEVLKQKAKGRRAVLRSLYLESGRAIKTLGDEPGKPPKELTDEPEPPKKSDNDIVIWKRNGAGKAVPVRQ